MSAAVVWIGVALVVAGVAFVVATVLCYRAYHNSSH